MGHSQTRATSHYLYLPHREAAERAGQALALAVGGHYNGYRVRVR